MKIKTNKAKTRLKFLAAASIASAALASTAHAIPTEWTQHNDNSRSGGNTAEAVLTPSNVNSSTFGKLFTATLDDESYGQPLYIPGVVAGSATHNMVFATTVNNSVYGIDADSGTTVWHVNLTPSGASVPTAANMSALGACGGSYHDFAGKIGIVGTPVISTTTNSLYVVARSIESGTYVQRLHMLNIATGAEQAGSPVVISGSVSGVSFNAQLNNQRPALALVNGVVYIGWSSQCDFGAYHGFLMGYNASTLAHVSTWAATSSSGSQAGIWQGGQGPTADASNNLYLMTGNGTWDGSSNFGESAVKLSTASSLAVSDYFTPSNWSTLNGGDTDLGSAGILGIPGTTLVLGGGKQGKLYLMNTANMSHENATDAVVQEFQATFPTSGDTGHIHGGPVYFTNGTTQYIYVWGENDFLRAFTFNGSTLNSTTAASSTMRAPVSSTGMPGGFLAVSSNGTSNGIVWALTPYNGDANHGTVAGILHAFNAIPSGSTLTELWNSQQNASRDSFGNFAKFSYPTIANGKVYVSTFGSASSGSGTLVAYGPITASAPSTPTGVGATPGNAQITISWTASGGATSYNLYRSLTAGAEGTTPYKTGITSTSSVDTGLTNGTSYYYKVAAVNSVGTSAQSNEVSATPSTAVAVEINSGGSASAPFVADVDFSGGTAASTTAAINTSQLIGTIPPQAVLQTNRYGNITYTIPGFTASSAHTVTLYFAESYWTASGKRKFNVQANGTTVISNLDIYASAGGQNKAIQRSFTTSANASGQVVLKFVTVTDNAQINGIVVN